VVNIRGKARDCYKFSSGEIFIPNLCNWKRMFAAIRHMLKRFSIALSEFHLKTVPVPIAASVVVSDFAKFCCALGKG
jgi:hypothetical protein